MYVVSLHIESTDSMINIQSSKFMSLSISIQQECIGFLIGAGWGEPHTHENCWLCINNLQLFATIMMSHIRTSMHVIYMKTAPPPTPP